MREYLRSKLVRIGLVLSDPRLRAALGDHPGRPAGPLARSQSEPDRSRAAVRRELLARRDPDRRRRGPRALRAAASRHPAPTRSEAPVKALRRLPPPVVDRLLVVTPAHAARGVPGDAARRTRRGGAGRPMSGGGRQGPNDLGFGAVVSRESRQRLLNRDGTFNVERVGIPWYGSMSLYHTLINTTWTRFLGLVSLGYLVANFGVCPRLLRARPRRAQRARGGRARPTGSGSASSSASRRWPPSATAW